MIKVLELPHNADLAELSRELWVRKIGHQIRSTAQGQEILLANPEHYPQLMALVQDWQNGTLAYTVEPEQQGGARWQASLSALLQWPVTAFLLIASVLATALISFEAQPTWFARLAIVPFQQVSQGVAYMPLGQTLISGEFWRLITPAFLHFGALHLIFNSLWVWEIGRMIERQQSSGDLIVLFLFSSISANLAQYMMGDILFGGLSGVVYALLGYCWLWDRLSARPLFYIRRPVLILLLVWLVFCLVGGASMLGFGDVANAAHVGGLISGGLMAWLRLRMSGGGR